MKKLGYYFILFMLTFLIVNGSEANNQKNMSVAFKKSQLVFKTLDGYDLIELEEADLNVQALPGTPLLPVSYVRVAVPATATFESLKIISVDAEVVSGSYHLYPTQIPTRFDQVPSFTPPDSAVYSLTTKYPETIVEYVNTGIIAGFKFFVFKVSPVQYIPASKKICFNKDVTFNLSYELTLTEPETPPISEKLKDYIKSIVVNPDDVSGLEPPLPLGAEKVDYLIITSNILAPAFEPLRAWKIQKGISTKVLTTESISTKYSGADLQEKIRNAIKDYWLHNGTLYALLGGDDTVVPDRDCQVTCGSYKEYNMPTDLYYSGLDGSWDTDGDCIFCERVISGIDSDGVDLDPDIFVGRAAVQTYFEAEGFVNKVIQYELNPPANSNFQKRMLLVGPEVFNTYYRRGDGTWFYYCDLDGDSFKDDECNASDPGYTHSPVSDAEIELDKLYNDFINPYYTPKLHRFYDTLTSFDSLVAGDCDLTPNQLGDVINDGYNFITVYTHGLPGEWSMETGGTFTTSNASNLLNSSRQGIIYTIACTTNKFDNYDPSLSESFIRNPNGGSVAYIGCSRYGWWKTSNYYAEEFHKQLFGEKHCILGETFAFHKQAKASSSGRDGVYRWLQFGLNLIGDPTMEIWTDVPKDFSVFHQGVIPMGASSYTLQIPEDGALVSLVKDHEILGTAVSIGGSAIVNFEKPIDAGVIIQVTVTKHNFRPYLGKIRILSEGSFLTKNSIAYDTHNNRYLLVYKFNQYIYGQLKNFDGTPFGDNFVISDSDAIDDRRSPSVAYDSANQKFLVVWTDLRNRETTITDIYGQIVNADGTRNNDNFVVSKAVNFQDRPSVAYDSANQRFLVVWQDYRYMESTRYDIYGQIVDAEGNPYGANFVLSNADSNQVFPSVAYDSANQRFLVVWSDYRNWNTTGYDIYGQIVKADGNPYGGELIISNHVKSQVSPSVTYDIQNQRFLVVWSDGRGGESTIYDIYGRILDTVGNFYTDDFVISKAVQFQWTPSAAYDSANQRFLVVWSDDRNVKHRELEYQEIPNSDIYGQIVQGDGNLYGGNLAISDADGGQRSPSVAYNSNIENFLVAFNTYKTDKPAEMGFAFYIWSDLLDRDNIDFEPIVSTFITTTDNTGCPEGFVGKFSFDARLTNTSDSSLTDLVVEVAELTNENLLQNADGAPGGEGLQLTIGRTDGYSDGVLGPGESVVVPFTICLTDFSSFRFFVDVLGVVR